MKIDKGINGMKLKGPEIKCVCVRACVHMHACVISWCPTQMSGQHH